MFGTKKAGVGQKINSVLLINFRIQCEHYPGLATMHFSAAILGGGWVTPGNPRSFVQRRLQNPPTQNQDCLTKSY